MSHDSGGATPLPGCGGPGRLGRCLEAALCGLRRSEVMGCVGHRGAPLLAEGPPGSGQAHAGRGLSRDRIVLVNALGEPVRPELYSDQFRRLSRAAGLREIHLHLIRHTLAVAMNRAGVALVDAAPLLGTRWMSMSAPI
jgi:hypothetical protein